MFRRRADTDTDRTFSPQSVPEMLGSIDIALETNDCRPPPRPRANMCQSYPYGDEEDHGLQSRKTRFMDTGLAALGIRRLNELLEEDVDRRKKKENVSTYRFELALLVEVCYAFA